ncbi:hypothetical protein B0H12DRAFT_1141998 [Mycena haematopus]|nr:hypothetical protein B0H12DRAFT_1141998 [Mycena haematopus]
MMSSFPLNCSIESILSDLRFNVVPDPSERLAIRVSLVDAEEWLQEFPHKAPEKYTDTELSNIEHQRDELDLFIPYSSSRLAPIRRLHPEILSLIFLQSILDFPLAIGRQTGFPVAAVSFHWRAVALATPSLWSRFSLSLRGGDAAYRMLQLCLDRAKVSLLTIEIRKDAADLRYPVHSGIVDRLIQTSDRWLRISFPLDHELLPLFAPVRGRLPSLEIASFAFSSPRSSQPVAAGTIEPSLVDIDAFEIAPKLCSLSLRNARTDLPLFPLNQLERMLFINITPDIVFSTIIKSPNLRSLTCRWTGHDREPNPPAATPSFIFASLTTIDFKGDYHLLRHITAPNLESLSLTDIQQFAGPNDISGFIQRSEAHIHTLLLEKTWAHWTSIVEVLRLMPTLHALTFVDGRPNSVTDKAIEVLVVDLDTMTEAVLPNLRSFTLHGSYLFSTRKLLDMLESRVVNNINGAGSASSQLRLVDLRLDQRLFAEGELERFRALKGAVEELSLRRMDQKVCVEIV